MSKEVYGVNKHVPDYLQETTNWLGQEVKHYKNEKRLEEKGVGLTSCI